MEEQRSKGRNEWLEELSVIYAEMRKSGMDRARKIPFPNRELFEFYNEQCRKDGTPTGLPCILEYKDHKIIDVGNVFECLEEISKYGDYCFFDGKDCGGTPDDMAIFRYAESRHFHESHSGKKRFLHEIVSTFTHDRSEVFPKWTNKRNREVISLALVEMFTWSQNHQEDIEDVKRYLDYLKSKKTIDRLLLKL